MWAWQRGIASVRRIQPVYWWPWRQQKTVLQGRLDAAIEQRTAEGAAAAQDLSLARAELDAARAAVSAANAAVMELRGGLDAARAREQEQQRLLSEMQVRRSAAGRTVCDLHLPVHASHASRAVLIIKCQNQHGHLARMPDWVTRKQLRL